MYAIRSYYAQCHIRSQVPESGYPDSIPLCRDLRRRRAEDEFRHQQERECPAEFGHDALPRLLLAERGIVFGVGNPGVGAAMQAQADRGPVTRRVEP